MPDSYLPRSGFVQQAAGSDRPIASRLGTLAALGGGTAAALASMRAMKAFSEVGLVLMLCLHDGAEACEPRPPSVDYAREASFVAIGHVLDDREDGVELRVRVQVSEVLVGKSAEKLEAVSPCHLPVERGERVVVARIGEWLLVYPAEMYEESFRESFAASR